MRRSPLLIAGGAVLVGLVATGRDTGAHKLVTSKYTYTTDIYPILRDHCGRCHRPGGVAPMSLLSYDEAYPWAQSIKEELVSLRMPPFHAEAGVGRLKYGRALTAQEIDRIVEWSSGGTPRGDAPEPVAPAPLDAEWPLGDPDLIVAMPGEFTLDKDTTGATRSFVLETELDADHWIRALDFQPGSPSIVRSAVLAIDRSGEAHGRDEADTAPGIAVEDVAVPATGDLLALWLPGTPPLELIQGAYHLPADADLVLRVAYKKNWMLEGTAVTDRSRVALYFGEPPAAGPIEGLLVEPGQPTTAATEISFSRSVDRDLDVLAVLAEADPATEIVQIDAVRPDGAREPLLLLNHPDPAWQTRYWFEAPVALPKGSRIEVQATLGPGQASRPRAGPPLRLRFEVVSTPATASQVGAGSRP